MNHFDRRACLRIGAASWFATAVGKAAEQGATPAAKRKMTKADIEEMMGSLSNWGRWGKDDQLGTLNLVTPAKRKQAAGLVRDGIIVSLARNVAKEPMDASAPFVHRMLLPKEGTETGVFMDEYSVRYHGMTQTHLDALCHLFYKGRMYNGFSRSEVSAEGARKLSVLPIKNGIMTRGVLMDIVRLSGARYLPGTRAIYPEDLEAWEKKAGVKIDGGYAVLIRTGRWARRELEGPWDVWKGSAGLHASCLPWLKQRDVALIGSDLSTDLIPSGIEGVGLPVHLVSLVAMGMPILDNCDLDNLGEATNARKRWEFLLTVAPLAVEGGTGSPVNPLATF